MPSAGPRRSVRLAATTARRPGRDWYRARDASGWIATMGPEYTRTPPMSNIRSTNAGNGHGQGAIMLPGPWRTVVTSGTGLVASAYDFDAAFVLLEWRA